MARSVDELESELLATDGTVGTGAAVVTLTEEAHRVVKEAVSQESDPEHLALWLEVNGVVNGSFNYELFFQSKSDAGDEDLVQHDDDLPVVIPAASVDRLRGARLEWSEEGGGGLVIVNPNTPAPEELATGVPPEVLAAGVEGAAAARVVDVLERSVNPSIASHGGRADLVALDEAQGVAYLELSGGCQGCAMSRMTLTQGIEVALKEQIPELTRVVDVTDHGGGENPYY